jgi:hypothetical protein
MAVTSGSTKCSLIISCTLSLLSNDLTEGKGELCGYHHRVDHVYSVSLNLELAVTEPGHPSLAGSCSFVFHVNMALCL